MQCDGAIGGPGLFRAFTKWRANDEGVGDIVPEKTDDAPEDKQRDERFVEEKTE